MSHRADQHQLDRSSMSLSPKETTFSVMNVDQLVEE